ncbi:GntR family transcriptional regulator [Acidisoma cellulosilytica]|uniref:GntR family transcriptional regulator n=1 Tax=Acidisoma cellulosilyticum TaxID=2802395 RepID=A0A963Z407_9PROT|nr:GntR family transcriptional regulator [Acidisoma cellulosilyticum]MCB8881348.1 GntR family transcriptional regulator [Acidisoma cellulosilyticum]
MAQTPDSPTKARKDAASGMKRAPILARRPLHEEVLAQLRDMIVEGDLAAGDRLNDAKLSEMLAVSRTPVREALKLLAQEGLVELLPRRGARVLALSEKAMGELLEVICGIERLAAELAADRMSQDQLDHMERLHARMQQRFAAGDRKQYFKLNHEIHLLLVQAACNDALIALHASLLTRVRRGRYAALLAHDRWAEAMTEHEELMAALRAHDAERAGIVMAGHVKHTREALHRALVS